jgi:hypothetical protein
MARRCIGTEGRAVANGGDLARVLGHVEPIAQGMQVGYRLSLHPGAVSPFARCADAHAQSSGSSCRK